MGVCYSQKCCSVKYNKVWNIIILKCLSYSLISLSLKKKKKLIQIQGKIANLQDKCRIPSRIHAHTKSKKGCVKTLMYIHNKILWCSKKRLWYKRMQNGYLQNLTMRPVTMLSSHDAMQKWFMGSHVNTTPEGKQRVKSVTWKSSTW